MDYLKEKDRVRALLKDDLVEEVRRVAIGGEKPYKCTKIILKDGSHVLYEGDFSTRIYKYIFRKRYCRKEM